MARIKYYNHDTGEWEYADSLFIAGSGISVTGATVGQTIVVKAVDEYGKPTEWEVVNMPDSVSIGMELGVIDPVADEKNAIFTDEKGAIYSL